MKQVSRRRAAENRIRRKVVAQIVAERGPWCEVPNCNSRYDDAHEPLTRARGGSITDPANIRLVCRTHHDELGREPEWAYRLGFLKKSVR